MSKKIKRKIFFYPAPGQSSQAHWRSGVHACSDRSSTMLLAEYSDYSGKSSPQEGDRIREYKRDVEGSTFDHGRSTTHYRKSPWIVSSIEEYVANVDGLQKYTEVIFCYCDYQPLTDLENPWVEMNQSIVSPDSFGGDVQAFDRFVNGLSPEEAAQYQIVNPQSREPVEV